MVESKIGRPSKGKRGKAVVRLPEDMLREVSVYCEANDLERSDTLGDVIKTWWTEMGRERERVQAFLKVDPK